jgi:outer membrane protein
MNDPRWLIGCVAVLLAGVTAAAQSPKALNLKDAEAIAVKNHPKVRAALLTALAANQVTAETRSAYYPDVFGSVTGAGAHGNNDRISAGGITNSVIYERLATGFTVLETLTDFGRTSNLTASARLRAEAQQDTVDATRQQVLLQVDVDYFAALRAEAVLKVAEQTVAARQAVVDQVTALFQSKLKSGLDVSFANVNLSEAKLLLIGAQNDVRGAFADLSQALGNNTRETFALADEPLPPALPDKPDDLILEALRQRPDLLTLRLEHQAALRFAAAEKDLSLPTVSAVGAAGHLLTHDNRLPDDYAAAAINLNVPVFNGRLFSARKNEARLRAEAVAQNVRDSENLISRDVAVQWLNANTAFQRLAVTKDLLNEAKQALDLAQARYDLGLGAIVELSQAQLNETSAEIASARALYEYQGQRSVLAYQTGALR